VVAFDETDSQFRLKLLLIKYKHQYDRLLIDWKTDQMDLQLKSVDMPFQLSPFLVPEIYEEALKKEISRLCDLRVLKLQVSSE
jgi:hypothetical protein